MKVSLDEYVPEDHLLRAVDRYLDLSEFRENLAESYSNTGRPSIDPELMTHMLIIGYCYGIRSERRLCEEVGMNLAYRWFCRLGLKDKVPDYSSFPKIGTGAFGTTMRFGSYLIRCFDVAWPKFAKVSKKRLKSSANDDYAGNHGTTKIQKQQLMSSL